jgi:ubiquinone/menaquinone biosynthesis C-methylase UbiE
MPRHLGGKELLVGIEGLAILRHLYDGADADAERRLDEVGAILNRDGDRAGVGVGEATPEADVVSGYGAWAATYDEPGNPIVALEQPAVWGLIDEIPRGRALDAACGTGRHAARLAALGHEVDGVDLTPEMLVLARANVRDAAFSEGDLRSIPADDDAYDLAVCGLALAHIAELGDAVAELSRVLAPGGRLVVSVLHPFLAMLGWQAPFTGADGRRGFVREHPHAHADYLQALRSAGLTLEQLIEPRLTRAHTAAKRRATRAIPEATFEAYAGLPGVLVLLAVKP